MMMLAAEESLTSTSNAEGEQVSSSLNLIVPDVEWNEPPGKVTWFKVLSVVTISLVINVVILIVYIFTQTEPTGTFAALGSANALSFDRIPWAPLPRPDQVLTSLAFGSCNAQYMPNPHWDTLSRYKPDLIVLTGDNVYGDCQNETCAILKQAYDDLKVLPSFLGVKSMLSMVATLDDHDYGQTDCHADNPYKETAKNLFLEFFNIDDERRDREGVYKSYLWGSGNEIVQLILLDTRYNRSPFRLTDEPHKKGKEVYVPDFNNTDAQMLSPTQWTWLENELRRKANVRLVVSSIQVLSEAHGFECWRMLPYELQRFEDLLRSAGNTSATIIISGDRHVGALYEKDGLVEMTASAWTHTIPFGAYDNCNSVETCDEKDELRIGDLVRLNNFGSVEIDWEKRELTIALRKAFGTAEYSYHKKSDQKTDAGEVLQSRSYLIL